MVQSALGFDRMCSRRDFFLAIQYGETDFQNNFNTEHSLPRFVHIDLQAVVLQAVVLFDVVLALPQKTKKVAHIPDGTAGTTVTLATW
jgi:hypothetical protein